MPQELTPDSFMAAQKPAVSVSALTPDAFMQARPAARPPIVPHPDEVDRITTEKAHSFLNPAPELTMSAEPDTFSSQLKRRLLAPLSTVFGGMTGDVRAADTPISRALGYGQEQMGAPQSNNLVNVENAVPPEIGPGVIRGGAEFASGMTSPDNLFLMAGMGAVPKVIARGLSAKFGYDMLKGAWETIPSVRAAWEKGEWGQVRQELTKVALSGVMGALAVKHAVKGAGGAEKPAAAPGQQYTITGQPVDAVLDEVKANARGSKSAAGSAQVFQEQLPPVSLKSRAAAPRAAADRPKWTNENPRDSGPVPKGVKSAQESWKVFKVALRGEKPQVPEFGPSDREQRVGDARERLSQRLAGTSFRELIPADRIAVDQLVKEGYGFAHAATPDEFMAQQKAPKATKEKPNVVKSETQAGAPGRKLKGVQGPKGVVNSEAQRGIDAGSSAGQGDAGGLVAGQESRRANDAPGKGPVTVETPAKPVEGAGEGKLSPYSKNVIDNLIASGWDRVASESTGDRPSLSLGHSENKTGSATFSDQADIDYIKARLANPPKKTFAGADSSQVAAFTAKMADRESALTEKPESATITPGENGASSAADSREVPAVPQPRRPAGPVARGAETKIRVPGTSRAFNAQYSVRELDDVHASHNAYTYQKNPTYQLVNDRNYADKTNSARIIKQVNEFDPAYLLTESPDANNGAPVIDSDGNVLGGNSRTMTLERVYGDKPQSAKAYKEALVDRAEQLGLYPRQIAGMERPVLVREIGDGEWESASKQKGVSDFNKTGTAALSGSERATAEARALTPNLVDYISGRIDATGPTATLADAMTGSSGTQIVNRLIDEGVFAESERPLLIDERTKAVTAFAKERVSKALLGQLFHDTEQMTRTGPELKNKLERLVSPLTRVQSKPDWNLRQTVRDAIDVIEYAKSHDIKNFADLTSQQDLFGAGPQFSPRAVAMAEVLRDNTPTKLSQLFKDYARDSEGSLFRTATPEDSFHEIFGGPEAAGPINPNSRRQGELGSFSLRRKRDEGVTLGGGLGSFAPFFKEDFAQMRSMIELQKAAKAEIEKSKTNPEQRKFGDKVIHYFTGERDAWGTKVNQIIDKLRKLVPDHVEQEALSLMRDFHNRPHELAMYLDGTHPDFEPLTDPRDLGTARKRIEQLRPAILRAMDPTPRMEDANKVLTKLADITLYEGKRLEFLNSRWTAEEYVAHLLHPKGEGELPTSIGDRVGRAMGGKIGRYFAFAEKRGYPSLLSAVVDNVKPKTLNAFDAFQIHGDKFATARASHLLIKSLKEAEMGVWGVKDKAPEGWVPLAEHSAEFRNLVGYTDEAGEPQAAEQKLFVPKFIDQALRPITDPDYMGRIPLFRHMRVTQAYQKAIQLGLSFFHATTENYMALANSGVKGWVKALRADRSSPEFLAAERDMIAHGGTSPIQGNTYEAYKALTPGSIPSWGDILRRAPVLHEMDVVAGKITEFTFGNLQRRFKVTDYQLHLAQWLARNKNATSAEVSAAKRSMAKEVNAVYGGLHMENLGISRASTEIARALMLAPDWTFSNVFNVKYSMERGTPAGKMARMFWIRQLAGGVAATQLLSVMMSGKPSKQLTQVYYGKDKDGADIYQNIFFKGAGGDAVNLVKNIVDYGAVQGLARTLAGKAAPIPRAAMQLYANHDYLGHEIVPKGMNPAAGTVRGAGSLVQSLAPIPFSAMNLYQMLMGPDAGKYSNPEIASTLFAGNPPRHIAPEGTHKTSAGFAKDNPEVRDRSLWDQIRTGKVKRVATREEILQDLRDGKINGKEARRAIAAAKRAASIEATGWNSQTPATRENVLQAFKDKKITSKQFAAIMRRVRASEALVNEE